MNYRKLGSSSLEVSEIGFGGWGIGGPADGAPAYGETDDRESKYALRQAYDLGITFFDTSDLYGYGHSESLIGDELKNVRDRVVLTTKVGFLNGAGIQDFSPGHVQQSLEASLKRLQTDYVDLYQLHSPSIDDLRQEELMATLDTFIKEGKIRAYGISVRSPEDGLSVIKNLQPASVQVNFNLVDQRALTNGLFEQCKQKGVGIIARTPLCFGFLTGAYSQESTFESTDHRSNWASKQIALWADAPSLFASAVADDGEQTPAQMALRFCLSYASISTVIPGMLFKNEVEENAKASQMGPYTRDILEIFEQVYEHNTFFAGKS
jgi:aryl-alcohol dehydrogenase-like predicted oxidoreductase